jgi:hypothetical protein
MFMNVFAILLAEHPDILLDHRDVRIGDVCVGLLSVASDPLPFAEMDKRSVTVLSRKGCQTWGDLAVLTVGEIWEEPSTGRLTVLRILTAAAERNRDVVKQDYEVSTLSPQLDGRTVDSAPASILEVLGDSPSWQFLVWISELSAWAVRDRGAEKVADIIGLPQSLGRVPAELMQQFQELGELPLRYPVDSPTIELPSGLAATFIEEIGERAEAFVARNILLSDRPTLAQLGTEMKISRERVRQLVEKTITRVDQLRQEPRFKPLIWRAVDLADVLGTAASDESELVVSAIERACRGLEDSKWCTTRELLLWLAGPYAADNGWLVRSDSSMSEILATFEDLVDGNWLIPIIEARHVLTDLGVKVDDEQVVNLLSGWKYIGEGWLVSWKGTLADKAEIVMRLVCRPSTVGELDIWIGGGHAYSSLRNVLASDQRFVRLDKFHRFGLREWDLEEYSGIAQEITERIERAGGVASLDSIIEELVDQFGVSENSVRMFANAPAFVREHGFVRLRTTDDAYQVDTRINRVSGLYVDSDERVIFHMDVDRDTLRGSGRSLPEAAATAFGLRPGARGGRVLACHCDDGPIARLCPCGRGFPWPPHRRPNVLQTRSSERDICSLGV